MSKLSDELAKRLAAFDGRLAKVGWFESAEYPNGKKVAEIAMIQEHGAPGANIPPRPFMRPTIDAEKEKWIEEIERGARAVMRGATTADNVLTIVGQKASADIRQAISAVSSPALAKSTKEQRARDGFTDEPLNRTGYMIATCTSIVGGAE